jgi:UDPglucose 6-dehydrogenase
VRSSVAVDLVNDLIREGAQVTAYDPKGNERVQELNLCPGIHLAGSALEAVRDAETLVLATEWPDFAAIDLAEVYRRMHTPIIFDGRNLFDPDMMRDLGFQYYSVGRGTDQSRYSSGLSSNLVSIEVGDVSRYARKQHLNGVSQRSR